MRFRTEDMLKSELAALPELTPPAEAEARVLEAMRAAAAAPPIHRGRRGMLLGAALAAAAALAAVLVLWQPLVTSVERTLATGENPALVPMSFEDYAGLVERSAELERVLFALPPPRRVMTAGTVGTIVTLEDQIARIDAELTLASSAGLRDEDRAALWRERVDVMNALVQVRYAQSPVFDY